MRSRQLPALSRRFTEMGTESGMRYLLEARELEAQGVQIAHLEIGEPHFATPPAAVEAAVRALRDGETHYGPAAGLPELRAAIATDVAGWSGIPVTARNVNVLPGSKSIALAALLALTEPGDEVIVFDPGFPVYAALARLTGCTVRTVRLSADERFRPSAGAIASAVRPRTRLLFANWPHNPTGTVLRAEDARAIGDVVRELDLVVVSDELYRDLEFVDDSVSLFASIGDLDRCILMDGFSKRWAMTGWRLGFGVASEAVSAAITALTTNTTTCATTFAQHGAIAALREARDWQDGMRSELRRLRDVAVTGLRERGIRIAPPQAGLYCFARFPGANSRALAKELLRSGVATMPGVAFGGGGEEHLRITFSVPEPRLREGIGRLPTA